MLNTKPPGYLMIAYGTKRLSNKHEAWDKRGRTRIISHIYIGRFILQDYMGSTYCEKFIVLDFNQRILMSDIRL